jgi:hypothetical protein
MEWIALICGYRRMEERLLCIIFQGRQYVRLAGRGMWQIFISDDVKEQGTWAGGAGIKVHMVTLSK